MVSRLLSLCVMILLPDISRAADLRPMISREAVKYVRAWTRSDYPAIAAFLPPRVIQQSGGRGAVVQELKSRFAEARALGATELEASAGAPTSPKQLGNWLVAMLPLTAVLRGNHLALTQETHVLALSADRGRKWHFILLYEITQPDMDTWFPEFQGRVRVPKPAAPRLDVVY